MCLELLFQTTNFAPFTGYPVTMEMLVSTNIVSHSHQVEVVLCSIICKKTKIKFIVATYIEAMIDVYLD